MEQNNQQKKQKYNGCTVSIVLPAVRNQDVENAVLSILMESYEERLSQAVLRE